MAQWDEYNFKDRIREILRDVHYYKENHKFGRPFLTAYQIAIEFAQRYPEDFRQIGLQVGGEGIGQRNSLAQYIAGQLSRRIDDLADFEGSFISNNYLNELSFENNDVYVKSSLTDTEYDLSMFRLRQ
jgi:hypothetical protein